jgi:hypothetical protein
MGEGESGSGATEKPRAARRSQEMPEDQSPLERNCPNCGAALEGRRVRCAYCGTWVQKVVSEDELRDSCVFLIDSMNKSLESTSTAKLIGVFIVCVLLLPLGVFFLSQYMGSGLALKLVLSGLTLLAGLVAFGFVITLEQSRLFKKELQPRIRRFLERNDLAPEEFLAMARDHLKESDPLYEHLDRLIA